MTALSETATQATSWTLSENQQAIGAAVAEGMTKFGLDYWHECDETATFPHQFFEFAAAQGWLGVAMPEEYGGAGLGISEAAVMLEGIAKVGGLTASSAIHMNVFGTNVVVKHGSDQMRREVLPEVSSGRMKVAFGVTEPNVGLDTTRLKTKAVRRGGDWVVSGRKVWISTAQIADKILLLTRTSERDPARKSRGLTLFFTDLDRSKIDVREIHKTGRAAVDSNELFIDDLVVPDSHRVGEVDRGFHCLLDGLNPERILVASEAIGIGRGALQMAVSYAKERIVFDRPIGQNQGIQFPLAKVYAELESAWLMAMRGAALYDSGQECGAEANIAKYLGGEYGFKAADEAMQTLGGYGYAREYHVERLWREVKLCRIAPVTPQLILAYLAENKLGLPKSY
ncbi:MULTISPECIES: acyl-CoA dehydrogenase family protein [unclassified Pseudofrankia]|uniref:acyl-CoA dehydrogenase family protein n=1 Tax=unclassified Pseudofrankia TaxID=2994372 RepID=UPI0008D991E9|nr:MULTISPECIES: acyl-CoA dehydrogenase family protein [unclassified Pseudofrankia]MDT3444698.1 acyl-CoA dehydrogenase family protein [Pseudofrankia sp. BMG5.37]OHV66565.1 acyl-CoA dehydrogenase [Pseudofrankia sp. BMG5.36]